jgi:YbbR domain-containing protein
LHRNLSTKLVAVALAVALWLYVMLVEQNPRADRTLRVPVEVRGLSSQLVLTGTPAPVEVTLRGARGQVESLAVSEVSAWVSVQGLRAGQHLALVRVVAPRDLTVVRQDPPRERITLEQIVTETMTVEVDLVGEAYGYRLGTPEVFPRRARVTGPRSAVDKVARLVTTADRSHAILGAPSTSALKPRDQAGRLVDGLTVNPAGVTVTVPATPVFVPRSVPVAPALTGSLPAGYRISQVTVDPPVVTVGGEATRIHEVDQVQTQPISLDGVRGSVVRRASLVRPLGVSWMSAEAAQVRIVVAPEVRGPLTPSRGAEAPPAG